MLHQLQMLAFNIHHVCSGMVKKVGSEQLVKYLTKCFTNIQHYLQLPKSKDSTEKAYYLKVRGRHNCEKVQSCKIQTNIILSSPRY
jgi:hypothetical protein